MQYKQNNLFFLITAILLLCAEVAVAQFPNDQALKQRMREADVVLTPSFGTGTRHRHKRGYQWSIYSIKTPMAWEITKGYQNTTILVSDWFETALGLSSHPEGMK